MSEVDIKDFTLKILEKLGAKLEFITSDVMVGTFPEEISGDIGTKVYFSFIPVPPEIDRGEYKFEPVVPGSDFLEKLISIAREKGGEGGRVFLEKPSESDSDTLPVSFFSVLIESVERIYSYLPLMEFNFRVIFLTDEKIESIYSILLDEMKNEIEIDLSDSTGYLHKPQEDFIYGGFSLEPEEAYEYARKLIIEKIKPQEKIIEEEQNKILHNSLLRLEAYYKKEMENVKKKYKEESSDLIKELTEELKQKKQELIEKHKIKIGVSLINFREVSVPAAGYQCVITKDDKRKVLQFKKDLIRGKVFLPSCCSCNKESRSFTLCGQEGHLLGQCCVNSCYSCKTECCTLCKPVKDCHICSEKICDDCSSICPVCKEVYCYSKHSVKCGKCEEDFCKECTVKCKKCGKDFCPGHSLTCIRCNNYVCTDHGGVCSLCNKSICEDHGKNCPGCGMLTCNFHFTGCTLCQEDYCTSCLKEINKLWFCKGCISLKKLANTDEIGVIFGPHLSKLSKIPVLNLKQWKKGVTERYLILTGSSFFNSYIFIIDRSSGNLIKYRSLGFLKALKDMFGG